MIRAWRSVATALKMDLMVTVVTMMMAVAATASSVAAPTGSHCPTAGSRAASGPSSGARTAIPGEQRACGVYRTVRSGSETAISSECGERDSGQ